jgi:hypothetical protein
VSVLNRFGLARAAIVTGARAASGAPLPSLPRLRALTWSLLRFSIRSPLRRRRDHRFHSRQAAAVGALQRVQSRPASDGEISSGRTCAEEYSCEPAAAPGYVMTEVTKRGMSNPEWRGYRINLKLKPIGTPEVRKALCTER